MRSWLRLAPPYAAATDNRLVNHDVLERLGRASEWIAGQHHEIRELALFDRTLALLFEILPSRVARHRPQRIHHPDAFLRPEHFAVPRDAVHRRPHQQQGIHWRDGGVAVHAEAQAALAGGTQRTDARSAFRPEKNIPMPVAPVVNVSHEKRGRHAEFAHAIELVCSWRLTVLDPVPRVVPRMLALRLSEGEQDIVDRRVAVAMDRHLVAAMVILRHELHQRFTRARRITAITFPARWL